MRALVLFGVGLLLGACASPVGAPPEGRPADAGGEAGFDAGETGVPSLDGGSRDALPIDAAAPDAGARDAGAPLDAGPLDPFAPSPVPPSGLTDVSADLAAVLEEGRLPGACERWSGDPSDREAMLLCGKYMFFYEDFGTAGLPEGLVHVLGAEVPEIGSGFSRLGLHPDPFVTDRDRPVGFSRTREVDGVTMTAFTCASCHFGQLQDGRFAVGAPNHDFDYGRTILALVTLPGLARRNPDLSAHHPDAVEALRPMIDRLAMDRRLRLRVLLELLPLLGLVFGGEAPELTVEQEGQYASWPPGTQDFVIAPLPYDDGVHTVSKISALWGLPKEEEARRYGMRDAMLGFTGVVASLENFLLGFVRLGGGEVAAWPADRLRPLAEYIYSLRAPAHPAPPPATMVDRGRAVFAAEGCLECHSGPRGGGLELYEYAEIGTDDAMASWVDGPDGDLQACCGIPVGVTESLTGKLKSPRLTGLWAMKRFLHNGSVSTLEALLCLGGPRPTDTRPVHSDSGHTWGCGLPEADRRALVAFLRTL